MTAIWVRLKDGNVAVDPLPLPYRDFAAGGEPDDVEERRRLAAAGSNRPLHASSVFELGGPLRTAVMPGGTVGLPPHGPRYLNVVLSGALALQTAGTAVKAGSGSILFVDAVEPVPVQAGESGAEVLQLSVPDTWLPEGILTKSTAPLITGRRTNKNYKRVYKGADDRSYVRPFPELLPEEGQGLSSSREVVGLWFAKIPQGFVIDWHPEIVNQLVVPLEGTIEIETGGGAGAIERFAPGDVLLAEDRTGQGHIDRTLADLWLMVVVIDDEHLWPVVGGQSDVVATAP